MRIAEYPNQNKNTEGKCTKDKQSLVSANNQFNQSKLKNPNLNINITVDSIKIRRFREFHDHGAICPQGVVSGLGQPDFEPDP